MHFQINSYLVPMDKREEHSRLMRRFKQELARLGCEQFEVIEEAESNWVPARGDARVMQIMTFRDRATTRRCRRPSGRTPPRRN